MVDTYEDAMEVLMERFKFTKGVIELDQGGIDSILFYYETYGDKIEQHIPDKYIDEFYKRKIKEKTK